MSFTKNIQNFIFHEKLFRKRAGVVIGISGGPDSVCLTKVLLGLKKKYDLRLSLLHVNYALRGDDSQQDEKFVKKFAEKNSLKLKVIYYNNKETKGNLEDKLRKFRYEQLEKESENGEYDLIAVGHTMDDQAETVLMNLIRGCGLKGLGAMKLRRGKIVRPLLATTKKDILSYLKKIGQEFCIDKSNIDSTFVRNRIRKKLIPMFEKEYNQNIKSSLYNLSENIWRANEVIDGCVKTSYNGIVEKKKRKFLIDIRKLVEIHEGMQAEIFRKIIRELKGDIRNVTGKHFFEFKKIIRSEKGKKQEYRFVNIIVHRKGGKIILSKNN